MKTIVITVSKDGTSQVETKGFTGNSCQEASRLVERALGKRTSERLTEDYFQVDTKHESHNQEET